LSPSIRAQLRERLSPSGQVRRTPALIALACLLNASMAHAQATLASSDALKKLSMEDLMNVEVTSVSKRPEKLSQSASAVQVITHDDIKRSGATSLPEALRLASNLEVAQIDSRQWAISARGFNSTTANKLLVLIDGRTVYTPLYAGVFWEVQDTLLEDIERIEVISGPGATLWGANAVNGVINITTKNAAETQGALATVGGGDELQGFGGLRYGGTLGSDFRYRVYGKYSDRDGTVFENGTDASDQWHMGQGGFRIDGKLSGKDSLTVQGDLYDGRAAQPTAADIALGGANLLGRWSRIFSAESDLKLQLYFDRTHRQIPASYSEDLDTYDLDLQHHLALGARHDVVWGIGYRFIDDVIANPSTFAFLPTHVTRRWYSGFAQDEIALVGDVLHFTLGAKLEHNEYTGFEFQPSARLSWRVNDDNVLWSAVSRAVRTPSRIDREFYAPANPPFSILQGGADFQSEKLLAYELGFRTQVLQRLTAALSTFYNDYDDLRSVEHINPSAAFPIYIGNGLKGKSYGAELTADYQALPAWRLHAGYTELRVHLDHKPGSTDTNPGTNESHDPNQYLLLRSSLDLPAGLQFDATFRRVSRIANQAVPAYGEMDLRLAWQAASKLEVSVTGQNLLHAHHPEFGAETGRREIERSVYGKITWGF
jgi:iron complex outermembrane recepter protein